MQGGGGAMSAGASSNGAYGGAGSSLQPQPQNGGAGSSLQPQPQSGGAGVCLAYTQDGTNLYKYTPVRAAPAPPVYYPPPAPPAPLAHSSAPWTGPVAGNGAAAAVASPVSASAEQPKRKRGRPRKYDPDGPVPLAIVPAPAAPGAGAAPFPTPQTLPPGYSSAGAVLSPPAPLAAQDQLHPKKRGRPPSSATKKQQQPQPQMAAPGSGGSVLGLKPHVLTVQAGEDIATKVMSFSRNGWSVCVLSANGAVSNVMLRHTSSGATVNYEGRFEILHLSGSYLLSESAGLSSRTGSLCVSLASPDGHVVGGVVAGPLMAASPVQVVIGSFARDGKPESKQAVPSGVPFPGASSPSRGTYSGSSGGPGSPPNQSSVGTFNNNSQPTMSQFSWQ